MGPAFDGRRYRNPDGLGSPPWSVPLALMLARRPRRYRARVVRPQTPPALEGARAVVTFIGHSTFLIQTPRGHILTDPVFSDRVGPLRGVGTRRVRGPGIPFDDLPPIGLVLLSHNHYDHCDLPTLRALAARWRPRAVAPRGLGPLLRRAGFHHPEELTWWDEAARTPLPVMATPARHCSARSPLDRDRTLWASFVIDVGGRPIYFAGDSGYGSHFAAIREARGPMAMSLLPIGAGEPSRLTRRVHMNAADAVRAHGDLCSARSLAMHFGTFRLTPEDVDAPVHALADACRRDGVPEGVFAALDVGASARLE